MASSSTPTSPLASRAEWVDLLDRVARPVLAALAERRLKATMPIESSGDARYEGGRTRFSHLEALARALAGVAPWLELSATSDVTQLGRDEFARCSELADLARTALDAATDPTSPDVVNFDYSLQPIVDAAFLAQAVLRAPNALWERLDIRVRVNVVDRLRETRSRKPHANNWLLFAAIIEAALHFMGAGYDPMRVDYALRSHEGWYLGDGIYGDGPEHHFDYYNSFVIVPMLLDVLETVGDDEPAWKVMLPKVRSRAARYAAVLERFISPEGTFPPIGRSLAYRCGAMQLLALIALRRELPTGVEPAQVRCALAAVISRSLNAPGTFDAAGWLRIGFAGAQPEIGEM